MSFKYLGILEKDIAEYWNILEHKNKPILVFEDRKQHVIDKHLNDFGSVESIENVYKNLSSIINKPDYVFYNQKTKGLEYYKKLKSNICVAVRVNPGRVLKVKSWYPANKTKLKNRIKKGESIKISEEDMNKVEQLL